MKTATEKILEAHGFEKTHTGGGCEAFERRRDDGSFEWLTDGSGCDVNIASDSWNWGLFKDQLIMGWGEEQVEVASENSLTVEDVGNPETTKLRPEFLATAPVLCKVFHNQKGV